MKSENKRYLIIFIVILLISVIFLVHRKFYVFDHKRKNILKKTEGINSVINDATVENNVIDNIREKSCADINEVTRDIPKKEKPQIDNDKVIRDVLKEENKITLPATAEEDQMNTLFDDLVEELEILDFKDIDFIPILSSPEDCNLPSLDENSVFLDSDTLEFFKKHNDMMNGMSRVDVEGNCQWSNSPEKISPVKIEYTRANQQGDVHSENAHCTVQGHLIKTFNDEFKPMLVDSLYLLMFRKYDPKKFSSVKDGELLRQNSNGEAMAVPVKIVESPGEIVCFETQTGHLLRAEISSEKMGVITIDMDNYVLLEAGEEDELRKFVLPLEVRLKIPDPILKRNFQEKPGLEIRLTIDGSEQIQIK